MMALSSSCLPHFKQHPSVVATNFSCSLRYPIAINCNSNGRICNPVRLKIDCLKIKGEFEGTWEEPDDGSDDSEFESDEDESMEDNDLDYESDWEGNESAKTVRDGNELAAREYEDDLVRDVEQMLSPEELAILKQNEAPNLEKLSTGKWKLLHTYALSGQIKFMDGILERGHDIDLVDKDGLTPLHLAVIGKREAVISHLLRKGANPKAKDQDGATPLHYAAQVGALQTVKLLIKYKANVNAADNEGWTPLHVAMQTRNRDIVKVLLVNGADRILRNQAGNTALDLAMCYGKEFRSYELAKLVKQVPARDF
ncbi:ankyrin repeat domain-containing protein EMB506, chloroplastic [Andrographis paniculata]|uniref:ankyrin repeat domain-containing protein EMB506, chloroplastic n=1 Tax=Andrographis paniculata TaxID=175694 RepID=UPI0021E812E3|nr:ankyrin repeat domain-containing protein EMB506, chloroplastic [Andrographis paniculata]